LNAADKILILGDLWSAPLFAHAFAQLGQQTEIWISDSPPSTGPEAIYLGNGETRAKAGLIFGEPLAEKLWEISAASFEAARRLLHEQGVAIHDHGLFRAGSPDTNEAGFSFSPSDLSTALLRGKTVAGRFQRLVSMHSEGLETKLRLKTDQGERDLTAAMVVVATESFEQNAIPWLADKRIPCTLTSLLANPTNRFTASAGIFNGGADFAVNDGRTLRLGSWRNLYADRGVGLHSQEDARTREGITRFFEGQGWLEDPASLPATLRIESLSCDGIPLVGTVPGLAGAVFAVSFAARGACFLFEVANQVARSMVGKPSERLDVFSPRRLL
jgi:glycine/D-amino acid oxidase-like deaminating enzyme